MEPSNDNFTKNFKNNEVDLRSCALIVVSADNFTTHTYSQNNNYLDLTNSKNAPSELWSENFMEQKQQESKAWSQQIKPDITMKQMTNKVKMTAESTKNRINGYEDSLI